MIYRPSGEHGPLKWEEIWSAGRRRVWAGVDWARGAVYIASTDPLDLPNDLAGILTVGTTNPERET